MAQIYYPDSLTVKEDYENIKVKQLYSDSLGSSFVIWVKKEVKAHKHEYHNEQVYVLDGAGEMTLEQDTLFIQKGDLIRIPKGTIHAVTKVYGTRPLKVLSNQTPEFLGKDRVFIEKE
ncbi:MAG: cupin domain-containing protein [Chitinophagales bacterium]